MIAITLVIVLTSAFVTNIIGIHAIFGGFLIGLLIPHDSGFAEGLTRRIEDLVGVYFLPIVSFCFLLVLSEIEHGCKNPLAV